jgi:transcriptional regulator NrdR family protein
MKHIVKRGGNSEAFDSRKLYASVYASCLSVHESAAVAELIAQKVTHQIELWLAAKTEVTSNDIRHAAGKFLSKLNPHAGYVYLHHRIMW